MRRQRDWPLRVHLAVFGLILLLPACILVAVGISYYGASERERTERTGVALANAISRQIDREIEGIIVALKTLATSPLLDTGDFRGFQERAARAIEGTDTNILLVDPTFRMHVNTRVPYGSSLPPTSDPETARAVFGSGEPLVSDLFYGVVAGEPVFNVEVPVVRNGKVVYVLIGTREAKSLLKLVQPPQGDQGWTVGVTDRKGVILFRSHESEKFMGKALSADATAGSVGRSGTHRATNLEGREVLRAYYKSRLTGWMTAAFIPVDLREATQELTWITFVLATCGLTLFTVVLATYVARRMALPVEDLRRSAEALGRGEKIIRRRANLREANEVSAAMERAADELDRRERRVNVLMGELAHRTKNILHVTLAIAQQTGRRSPNYQEFLERFGERVSALGAGLDLLVGSEWKGITIADLVQTQMTPFARVGGGRLEIGGPRVRLTGDCVQQIGMALHELATNATKYGALSVPHGRVVIGWHPSPVEDMAVRLTWREVDGPAVTPPSEMGFGRTVIERVVMTQLQARVDLRFDPEGFWWQVDLPESCIVHDEEPPPQP